MTPYLLALLLCSTQAGQRACEWYDQHLYATEALCARVGASRQVKGVWSAYRCTVVKP